MLGLLQHSFSTNITAISKKHLYISLVRSQLMFVQHYGKHILLKDIRQLEQLQCCTTKYILNDYTSNYKSRLLELKLSKALKPLQMHLISLTILNSLQETHDQDLDKKY